MKEHVHCMYEPSERGRWPSTYDHKTKGQPFQVNDCVWLHHPAAPHGWSHKLHCPWKGPFIVWSVISDVTYKTQHQQASHKTTIVHFDHLKPIWNVRWGRVHETTYIYQDIWETAVGEMLVCFRELCNTHDQYAMTVEKNSIVIGHLPRNVFGSRRLWIGFK